MFRWIYRLAENININDGPVEADNTTNAFISSTTDPSTDESPQTIFHSDANVVTTAVNKVSRTPANLHNSSSDHNRIAIENFLERPFIIQSGILQSTDTATIFPTIPIPQCFFSSDVYLQKVKGFLGIRFDIVIRMVVNATRFMSGRYMLIWFPSGGSDVAVGNNIALNAARNFSLVQRTQMPHAEIDINCDTEIIFKIPYSSIHNFVYVSNITEGNTYSGLGILRLVPYVNLQTVAGPTNCSYTIYANMENVQLLNAAVPQSRMPIVRRGRNETAVEQESGNIGPISSMLINVRDAASIMAKVPLLSSYATTTSWFADRMAHVASVFGFSRPVNLASTQRITRNIAPYIANTDGMDNSWPLSLSYKNEVGHMAGDSVTDLDEMDFGFLATIPVFIAIQPWAMTDTAGTVLLQRRTHPIGLTVGTTVVNGDNVLSMSPMVMLANMFAKWRGSLVIKLKFVKTEFHSGRLLVAFSPLELNIEAFSTPSLANTSYIHREIVDIRLCNEVTFTIPYVSQMPWRQCSSSGDAGATGNFCVFVLDKLVAPDTVPNNVQIIVEAAGGPDLEFAVPRSFNYTPFLNTTPQSSFPTLPNNCSIADKTIGTADLESGEVNSLLCIGEKISNFRTLVKKPQFIANNAALTPNIFTTVIPYLLTVGAQNGILNDVPNNSSDLYSLLGSMYVYSRGGIRLKFIPTTNVACPIMITSVSESNTTQQVLSLTAATDSGGNNDMSSFNKSYPSTVNQSSEVTEVAIPQYHFWPRRVNSDHMSSGAFLTYRSYITDKRLSGTPLIVSYASIDKTSVSLPRLFRSASEDANFSYFTCVPPLIFSVRAL